jgi:hypothetical protein
MLDTERVTDYLAKVRAYADTTGQRESLERRLGQLAKLCDDGTGTAARTRLFPDFAPHSFEFQVERRTPAGGWEFVMNGGLIYHGRHDAGGNGGAPTYAVTMSPVDGWSIHT